MLRPKNILEIGTANGISTLFFAYALQKNKEGIITSIEPQQDSHLEAAENIGKVQLESFVRLLHGMAEELIPDLPGEFDLVFIDGRKKSYKEYFLLALEKSHENTIFVFDDVIKWRMKMDDLFDYLKEKKYERMIVPTDPDDGVMILLPTSLDALDLC